MHAEAGRREGYDYSGRRGENLFHVNASCMFLVVVQHGWNEKGMALRSGPEYLTTFSFCLFLPS
jgi:hypothetical protein